MSLSAQINVRLPRELKESGDRGLLSLGLSPSDAIRTLWQKLSERGDGFLQAKALLLDDATSKDADASFGSSQLAQGWEMVDEYVRELGLVESVACRETMEASDNDLLAMALEDRMRKRGMM